MYAVHFRVALEDRKNFILVAKSLLTLEQACAKRVMSGDLVVEESSSRVVDDDSWLFEWEKADSSCYARRAMKTG
jgi:hypothetical protein